MYTVTETQSPDGQHPHTPAYREGTTGMTIYQASDLASKRTEILDAASNGRALIRDTKGQGLVLLPEETLEHLEQYSEWSIKLERLRRLLAYNRRPTVAELGDLAWLRVFDDDDLHEFCDELSEQLVACLADGDFADLNTLIRDWRVTAGQLEDPLRKRILLQAEANTDDFTPAKPPTDKASE